jgi:hypothetical protein
MRFSTRTLLAVITCCAVGLGTLVVGYRALSKPWTFHSTLWKTGVQVKRESMAHDFIANHFRPGMTRAEVVALLGEPNTGFPEMHYIVGNAMIDYVVLWVVLDAHGKTVEAFIYTTS